MASLKRTLTSSATSLFSLTLLLTGCGVKGGAAGDRKTGDGAILASVGGISDDDVKNAEFTFFLACNTNVRVKGEPKKVGDKEYVRFPGDQVQDGNLCSMEIRSDKWAQSPDYTWYGVGADGKRVPGLAYASDEQKVTGRKLSLKLYKLYSKKVAEAFTVRAEVEFESAAVVPATASASLVCGASESYGGTFERAAADSKNASLVFANLPVDKFTAEKACAQVVVLADAKKWAADTADLKVKDAKKGDTLKFPVDQSKRYAMKLVPASGGDIDVDANGTGPCLKYDTTAKKCLDVRELPLPWDKSIMIAKVSGKLDNGEGAVVTYYVAAGEKGFGVFEGTKLTTEALNKALKKETPVADKKKFNWYKESVATDLFTFDFDQKLVSGQLHTDDEIAREELGSLMVLDIQTLKVHGFHKVEAAQLSDKPAATWLAVVKATKDGVAEAMEFVVSGRDKYLSSATAPQVDGKPVYFDFKALTDDMAAATESTRWRAYAMKGAAMAPAACEATRASYVAAMSLRTKGELAEATATDDVKALDKCEIAKAGWKSELSGYKAETTLYAWEWFEPSR